MFKGEKEKKKKNPDCAIASGKRNSNLVLNMKIGIAKDW